MDKVISARVSEAVAFQIDSLSKRLAISKKRVLEEAIEAYAKDIEKASQEDVFQQTCGAWKRSETAEETQGSIRKRFRDSMERYRK